MSETGACSRFSLSASALNLKKRELELERRPTAEIGEVDRFFNDASPGSLKDLDRFPTIKLTFL